MKLTFTKMQGAGNDFVVIDATSIALNLSAEQWRQIADRRFGIGADQILLVQPADGPDVDFVYRIFNADGQEVEQCGNGARCFARFVRDQGLTSKSTIRVRTKAGVISPTIHADGSVTVDMGPPGFDLQEIGFDISGLTHQREGQADNWQMQPPNAAPFWSGLTSLMHIRLSKLAPGVSPTRAFVIVSTSALLSSILRSRSRFESSSAAQARPWPVAPVPVRPSSRELRGVCLPPPCPSRFRHEAADLELAGRARPLIMS
jgi:hypothetical protein